MSDLQSRLGALVDDLKRRGVLRVAAVYLVGAWLAIQVADIVFPQFGMPSWTVTFVIVLLALLFPVVIGVAWVFDFTRRGFERTVPSQPAPSLLDGGIVPVAVPATVRHRRATIGLAALMAIPLIGFGLWYVNDARGYSLDTHLVVVTPFRVAGAAPEVHYLREGLMDLIAARIGGANDALRVVAPRTVSRALRDEFGSIDADPDRLDALRLARELGAGRMLEGEVVGGRQGERITVTASLYDTFSGNRIGAPATIVAHPDSLHGLVDEIAARLVAAGSGVTGDQLAHLTTTSIPALRLFLEGEAAFRRGKHLEAVRAYDHAVSLDTTFALAALGLLRAQGWSPGAPTENGWDRAAEIVQRGIHRLSEADRLYHDAFVGIRGGTLRSLVELRLRAAERAPDVAEILYLAGDGLFHWGEAIGITDARERSRVLFERTVAMDTAYMEPLIHLHDLALARRDTAAVRRWGGLILAIDSTGPLSARVRFAATLGLAGRHHAGEAIDLDTVATTTLARLAALGGFHPPEERIVPLLLERFGAGLMPDEAASVARTLDGLGQRAGRPSLRAHAAPARPGHEAWRDTEDLALAVYWLRDADSVRTAIGAVQARLPAFPESDESHLYRRCLLGHGAIALGDLAAARDAIARLNTQHVEDLWVRTNNRACVLYLEAAVAVLGRAPDALARLHLFDDSLAAGVSNDQYMNPMYQLGAARLWEQVGQPARALTAVRRRIYLPGAAPWHVEMWGEEARYAEQLGRRVEAIDAYQRYLSFREHAEPPFAERAAAARMRLAALVGE